MLATTQKSDNKKDPAMADALKDFAGLIDVPTHTAKKPKLAILPNPSAGKGTAPTVGNLKAGASDDVPPAPQALPTTTVVQPADATARPDGAEKGAEKGRRPQRVPTAKKAETSARNNTDLKRATFFFYKDQLIKLKRIRQRALEVTGEEVDLSALVQEGVNLLFKKYNDELKPAE